MALPFKLTQKTERECNRCHKIKPLEMFFKHSTGKYGRRSQCKECESIRWKKPPKELIVREYQICKRCGIEKKYTKEFFPTCMGGKYLLNTCRVCWRKYHKKYMEKKGENYRKEKARKNYQRNRNKIIECNKEYYQNHREECIKQKTDYIKKNRKHYNEKERERYINSPQKRIDASFRSLISRSIKDKKGRSWEKLVGYSIEKLMKYLEVKFMKGMNWTNYGSTWQIDQNNKRCNN